MSNIFFAPGESNVASASFSPSVLLFWLKTEMGVSNTRFLTKSPNTLLGVIPLGYSDETYTLRNTAGVGVEVKFSLLRAVIGLVFLIIGLSTLTQNVFGIIFLLIGLSMLLNSLSAALKIQNNGGGVSLIRVSFLEKTKLEQFRHQINERLLASQDGPGHFEGR